MQANPSITPSYVNTPVVFPHLNIWERTFDKQIVALGTANHKHIDVYKELRAALGKCYSYVAQVIELSRRYGYGFHCSNEEFIEHSLQTISDRTLKRRKVEGSEFVTVKHGVKNRTLYYLNKSWFQNFINGILSKLGIQQGQFGPSHIISTDQELDILPSHNNHTIENLNEYDNLQKGLSTELPKPTKPKSTFPVSKTIASYTPEEAALHKTLQSFGIVVPLIARFIKTYSLMQIYDKIELAKNHVADPNKMGAYIRRALENIPTDLNYVATSGKITKSRQMDEPMKDSQTPTDSEIAANKERVASERSTYRAKLPQAKEAHKAAMELIKQKLPQVKK